LPASSLQDWGSGAWNCKIGNRTRVEQVAARQRGHSGMEERTAMAADHPIRYRIGRVTAELLDVLRADRENWREEVAGDTGLPGTSDTWPEIDEAIDLLEQDRGAFLDRFLLETPIQLSKGMFSLTSR
jgi:hypothetical protein